MLRRFVTPVLLLLGGIILKALQAWSTFDSLLTKLRNSGSAGKLMVDILVSPLTFLVLVVVAIGLIWKGIKEGREQRREGQPPTLPETIIKASRELRSARSAPPHPPVVIHNAPVFNNAPRIEQRPVVNQNPIQQQIHAEPVRDLTFCVIRARLDEVGITEWDEIMDRATDQARMVKAAIVHIRREVDNPAVDWIELKARAELTAPNTEPIHIPVVQWLDDCKHVNYCSFSIDTTRRFVLALVANGKGVTYEGKYQKTPDWPHFDIFHQNFQLLDADVYEIEVHLFGVKRYPRRDIPDIVVDRTLKFELRPSAEGFRALD